SAGTGSNNSVGPLQGCGEQPVVRCACRARLRVKLSGLSRKKPATFFFLRSGPGRVALKEIPTEALTGRNVVMRDCQTGAD
uniref:Uncharacterized protein n=1 Tax=Amphilophus citrinellus TaxID=61819 RepID=A0A3Q0QQH4_AMPCI